ncbi:MAG: MBL fold metallo-hydrolase [Dehalococcoidia bacterium]|nr:MBL fold metallo-hydrolase [Dehalococcoidia bacterium]
MKQLDDASGAVQVKFWGVRGSIPTPGQQTAKYGGNTSCVTVEGPDGAVYILDAGSGLRVFGMSMVADGRLPMTAYLLLTHTHWDHIQGLPFFIPAFIPGNRLNIYGSKAGDWELQEALAGQMSDRYFPVSMDVFGADLAFAHLDRGVHELGAATVRSAPLNHPGNCMGYRLELAGCTVAAVWDEEPLGGPDDLTPNPNALELARGADVLIHDAQYTDKEYAEAKVGWGHSPLGYVVTTAIAAEVPRLVLFHHEPLHADTFLDAMVEEAREMAGEMGSDLEITAAQEGIAIEIMPSNPEAILSPSAVPGPS